MESEPPVVSFKIEVPDEMEVGSYANFLSIWHGPHDFTLDFGVTGQPRPGDTTGGTEVPCRVVARVKIPITVAEDMLQAIATNLSNYEQTAGRIRKPGEDLRRPENPA